MLRFWNECCPNHYWFADNVTYLRNPRGSNENLLDLISELHEMASYKSICKSNIISIYQQETIRTCDNHI